MEERAREQRDRELQARVEKKLIHKGRVVSLETQTIHIPNESVKTRDLVIHPGAVAIFLSRRGDLLFIKQWRRAIGEILIEIPRGLWR